MGLPLFHAFPFAAWYQVAVQHALNGSNGLVRLDFAPLCATGKFAMCVVCLIFLGTIGTRHLKGSRYRYSRARATQ